MSVSVVIPTVRVTHLSATIESICRQTYRDWEMVVVAQGNDPELKAFVDKGYPDSRVRFLHLQERGASLARNAGIKAASHSVILFTDDDCEAQEDWISVVLDCFRAYPDVWLVGGALVAPPRPRWRLTSCPQVLPKEVVYDPAKTFAKPPQGWGWVSGNLAILREAYNQVGPFDTFLGPGARFPVAEDVDFGFRLERAHMQMLSTNRSIVHHTYGMRYGLRNVMRNSVNYARGNAAMAAKLTLWGDPRGAEWLQITLSEAKVQHNLARAYRLPGVVRRVRAFEQAYHECVEKFYVDDQGLLQLKSASGIGKPSLTPCS